MADCLTRALQKFNEEKIEEGTNAGRVKDLTEMHKLDTKILNELELELHNLMDEFGNDTKSINAAYKELVAEKVRDVKYNSARVISDTIKYNAVINRVMVKGDGKKTLKNILEIIEGKRSVKTSFRVMRNYFERMYIGELKKAKLLEPFQTGDFDKELYELANRIGKGNTDLTGISETAQTIFAHIKAMNNVVYDQMRLAGLNLKKRKDYLTSRGYSAEKILALGNTKDESREIFINEMTNWVDAVESWGKNVTDEDVVKNLGDMFDNIVGSQRDSLDGDLVGKKSYLNKLKKRNIVFKDGLSEFEMNAKFGSGTTLFESVTNQMDRSAKTVANMDTFGTMVDRNFNSLLNFVVEQFEGEMPRNDMKKMLQKIQQAYNTTVAPRYTPVGALDSAINGVRGLQSFTKLGSALYPSMMDVNLTAFNAAVRSNGNQFKQYLRSLKAFARAIPEKTRENMADKMNLSTYMYDPAVMMGGHAGDYNIGLGRVGNMITQVFNKGATLTGVPWQFNVSKAMGAQVNIWNFDDMVKRLRKGGSMTEFERLSMEDFDINADDMGRIIEHAKSDPDVGGISPSDILKIDLDAFHPKTAAALKMRQELFMKYSSWIDDAVHRGTPTPDAKTKRQMGKHKDNPYHKLFDLILQFKETAFKILMDNQENFARINQVKGKSGVAMGAGQFMALALPSYLAIATVKAELSNRKTPLERLEDGEDMRDLFFDFLDTSSILPLISDFTNRATSDHFNSNPTASLVGPTGGMIDDAFSLFKRRDKLDAGGRFLKRHILPSNWIPLKAWDRLYGDYEFLTNKPIERN